jgi:hypothetical protein
MDLKFELQFTVMEDYFSLFVAWVSNSMLAK